MHLQNANSATLTPQAGYAVCDVPQPSGIASRVQDLQKSVSELSSLAYQAKTALGINSPSTEGKEPNQPSSLAEVLTNLRMRVDRASIDLQDVISHLNS